jgi:hemolysin activation/secretion protein
MRSVSAAALGWCLAVCGQASANAQDEMTAPEAAQSEPAQSEPERRIDIFNYRIDGNSVLTRVDVETAVLPYLGPQRPVSDVEAARAALEKAYRDKGYETVGVEIPAQDVRGGIVHLTVTEMKVGRLRVRDARYFSPEDIKDRVPSLAEGSVPNYKAVSQQIADINKSADRLITPTLRAGDTPGTVDVDLTVEDHRPLHGSIELNDRASGSTERLRLSAGLTYANLFQRAHSFSLQTQFTPEQPQQSWVLSGSYVIPLQSKPWTFVTYGVHSDSDVATIGGIGVLGRGDIFGFRSIYTFTQTEAKAMTVHQITAGIDYKNFKEDLVVGPDTARTPIDYIPLTLSYSLNRSAEAYDLSFSTGLNIGVRGLAADDVEFRLKRFNASANWITLHTDASYTRRFGGDWRASAKLSAQLAGKPVISNEQFSAGGLDSVRGYYESQVVGDDGATLQLELDSPSLHKYMGPWTNDARLFAFADGATLRVYDPLGEQDGHPSLASIGAGFTLRALERFNASILLAAPLVDRKSAPTDIDDRYRVQMRLWSEF